MLAEKKPQFPVTFLVWPSGTRLHHHGKYHHFEWVNQQQFYGHVQVRKLLSYHPCSVHCNGIFHYTPSSYWDTPMTMERPKWRVTSRPKIDSPGQLALQHDLPGRKHFVDRETWSPAISKNDDDEFRDHSTVMMGSFGIMIVIIIHEVGNSE